MQWDPSATYVLVLVGGMLVFALAVVFFFKRHMPDVPPLELTFSNDAWGDALRAGERIDLQVPVLQPAPWFMQVSANPTLARANAKQLALTSNGALLVADRSADQLRDCTRYALAAVRIDKVKDDGEHHVSIRLVLDRRSLSLFRVPRSFLDRLREVGARTASMG